MERSNSRPLRFLAAVALIALLFAAGFAPGLGAPFERDEGEYAHAADLLASGGLPYRDTFLQKPPGIFLVYAAVQSIAGRSDTAIHLSALASYLGAVLVLAALARRLGGDLAGVLAALLAALGFLSPLNEPHPANTEAFLILPATAAYAILVRAWDVARAGGVRHRLVRLASASGLCLGIASLFKQVALAHAPHLLLGWLLVARLRRDSSVLALAFVATTILPWVLALSPWWAAGALGDFLEGVLLHNLRYVAFNPEGGFGELLARRVAVASLFDRLFWIAGVAGAVALAALGRRRGAFVAAGWLATAVLGVSAGGYFRGHYLLQAVPPLALSAALAASSLPSPLALVAATGLVATWVAARPVDIGADAAAQSFARYAGMRFANGPAIGRILASDAAARGWRTLFVLGSEPQLLHYSGLLAVTRWVIASPLTGGHAGSRERQEETWEAVRRAHPDYVVVSVPAAVPMFRHSDTFLWGRVVDLVRRDYEPLGKTSAVHRGVMRPGADVPPDFVPDLWIFRRRAAGGPTVDADGAPATAVAPSEIDWPPSDPAPEALLRGNPPAR